MRWAPALLMRSSFHCFSSTPSGIAVPGCSRSLPTNPSRDIDMYRTTSRMTPHDPLVTASVGRGSSGSHTGSSTAVDARRRGPRGDRKSTRLNSSHTVISYAVFCLKKKKKKHIKQYKYKEILKK